MRALRWPRFWLGLWLLAIAMVVVLSLIAPPESPVPTPRHFDKLLHFAAYFALAFAAVQLFGRWRVLIAIGLALILLGIAMEWAQATLVPHLRMLDAWDALANAVGVLAGLATAFTPLAGSVRWIEGRIAVASASRDRA